MILREYLEQKRAGAFTCPPGFLPQYRSFPHYIRDITEEIWEKRAIWLLFDTYHPNIIIHSGAGSSRGLDGVIHSTLKTLYAFPDRKMGAEAVIWSRYEDTRNKSKASLSQSTERRFFSSHRIISEATNMGASSFGPATNKHIHFRTIADCLAENNIICEEWLVRDNLFIVEQLGFDASQLALKDNRYDTIDVLDFEDGHSNVISTDNNTQESVIDCLFSMFNEIWINRQYSQMSEFYAENAISLGIRNAQYRNNTERVNLYNQLLFPFSVISLEIQQITSTYYEEKSEAGLRWRLKAKHSNDSSLFGAASAATVNILGINHYTFGPDGKIAKEWIFYDAYDTLCQIHRKN